jgi:hypothetical protein
MSTDFADQYLDVLKNLEHVIIDYYRENPALSDAIVGRVFEALVRLYKAELTGHTPPKITLSGTDLILHQRLKTLIEVYLQKEQAAVAIPQPIEEIRPLTTDEMLSCLKYLRRSVNFWTKDGGRQGYLNYVSGFL